MIGIGITTRNRRDVFLTTYNQIKKHAPSGCKIVVVDDASDEPLKEADFTFKHNAGIASAKNKCIELLKGCDHIFLFDDDCYPIKDGWEKPYIESGENHLMYIFRDFREIKGKLKIHGRPNGVMMYFNSKALDKAGVFDCDFGRYGYEHIEISNRFKNLLLTKETYADVAESERYIYCLDQRLEVKSTVPNEVKSVLWGKLQVYQKKVKYKHKPEQSKHGGIILASYFNYTKDHQRNIVWEADKSKVSGLVESCKKFDIPIKILTNCFETDDIFVKINPSDRYQPNSYRWFAYREYLKNKKFANVFMVDSTDVEVLRNPFCSLMKNRLYAGDETNKVGIGWMKDKVRLTKSIPIRRFFKKNRRKVLLNAGIVGGEYDIATEFLDRMCEAQTKMIYKNYVGSDMPFFNYVIREYFKERLTHGILVNTGFKKNEYNEVSYFKHK